MPTLTRQLFDADTSTYTYLLADTDTGQALLIDPVLDQMERDVRLLHELGLTLVHTLETHAHADHITSGGALRERLGSRSVVSELAGAVCADRLVQGGDRVEMGAVVLDVLATPGHTEGCISFVTADRADVFTGDALLIRGCGRTDFQGGDAAKLYRSIHEQLFSLPDSTRVWPGHDYRGFTRSTIGEEKAHNRRLGGGASEADFIQTMNELNLAPPKHIDVAVPANLRCGLAPQAAESIDNRELGWAPISRTSDGVPEVSRGWVQDNASAFRLVDVRDEAEHKDLPSMKGAESVPLDTLEQVAADWDPQEPVVVLCRSGRRSGLAAQRLEELGLKRVASMAGGLSAEGSCG